MENIYMSFSLASVPPKPHFHFSDVFFTHTLEKGYIPLVPELGRAPTALLAHSSVCRFLSAVDTNLNPEFP